MNPKLSTKIHLGAGKPDGAQGEGRPIRWRFWTADGRWHVAISRDPATAPEDLPATPPLTQGYHESSPLPTEYLGIDPLPQDLIDGWAGRAAINYSYALHDAGITAETPV